MEASDIRLLLHKTQGRILSSRNTKYVCRRSPHIEPQDGHSLKAGGPCRSDRPHHPSSGAGKNGVFGHQALNGLQGSARGHHPKGSRCTKRPLHLLQITVQHRSNSRLHQRRLTTGHEAWLDAHLVGTHHPGKTQNLQFISTLQLVGGIAMGMQQRHHHIIKTTGPKRSETLPQVVVPKGRLQLSAMGIQTARNFNHFAR